MQVDLKKFSDDVAALRSAMPFFPASPGEVDRVMESRLAAAAAVSFDIFDTLTARSVYHPVDLFWLLNRHPRFAALGLSDDQIGAARVQSDEISRQLMQRQTGGMEVNLHEIYQIFCQLVKADASLVPVLAAAEEEVDLGTALANEEGRPLFDAAARSGKPLVFVSDTYHSPAFLERLLRQCGYPAEASRIFASSHERKNKHRGDLFPVVLQRLGIAPGKLLHIGDNQHTDRNVPASQGIATLWHPFRAHPEARPAYKEETVPLHSRVKSLAERRRMPRREPDPFWRRFGFSVMGPLVTGFAFWLRERFEEDRIDRAYFLLRDGHLLHRAYRAVAGEGGRCRTQTLPGSRRGLVFPFLSLVPNVVLPDMMWAIDAHPAGEYLSRLGLDPAPYEAEFAQAGLGSSRTPVVPGAQNSQLMQLFRSPRVLEALARQAGGEREPLVAYLEKQEMLAGGRVAVVDVGWKASAQKALHALFAERGLSGGLFGYYVGTSPRLAQEMPAGFAVRSYTAHQGQPEAVWRGLDVCTQLLELACSDHSTGSLLRFRREGDEVVPVLQEIEGDSEQARNIAILQEGAVEFASVFAASAAASGLKGFPMEIASENLLHALANPTKEEALHLGALFQGEGLGTKRGRYLAKFRPDSEAPAAVWDDFTRAYWSPGIRNLPTPQGALLRELLWKIQGG